MKKVSEVKNGKMERWEADEGVKRRKRRKKVESWGNMGYGLGSNSLGGRRQALQVLGLDTAQQQHRRV